MERDSDNTQKKALVAGGGVSGMAAALNLADAGVPVVLLEKRENLGGYAGDYTCKAVEECVRCGACLAVEKAGAVADHPGIEVLLDAEIMELGRAPQTGRHGPVRYEVQVGAGGDGGSVRLISADVLILATGFVPFLPEGSPYGYGRIPDVITSLELEAMLKTRGAPVRPSTGEPPKRVAFIQCVGSRQSRGKHLWCSKVCCVTAIRLARRIRKSLPEGRVTIYYIDLQVHGQDTELLKDFEGEGLLLVRDMPAEIREEDGGLILVRYDTAERKPVEEKFDLVVLSVGISPDPELDSLIRGLDLELGETGFLGPDVAESRGIFGAGTVYGPMSITEAVRSGGRAAGMAIQYLRGQS